MLTLGQPCSIHVVDILNLKNYFDSKQNRLHKLTHTLMFTGFTRTDYTKVFHRS